MTQRSNLELWNELEVTAWLTEIGLSQYNELFYENAVDGEILFSISEEDLQSSPFNMSIFGHRRRLMIRKEKLIKMQHNFSSNDGERVASKVVLTVGPPSLKNVVELVDRSILDKFGAVNESAKFSGMKPVERIDPPDEQFDEPNDSDATMKMSDLKGHGELFHQTTNEFPKPLINESTTVKVDKASDVANFYPEYSWRFDEDQNKLLLQFLNCDSIIGKGFRAEVSYMVSPVEFYVQPHFWSDNADHFVETLSKFYDNVNIDKIPFAKLVYDKMPCAVRYKEDNKWYRAKVICSGESDCQICFVDWGNLQFCNFECLRPLTHEFGNLPPLALRCRIDGALERALNRDCVERFRMKIAKELNNVVYCVIKRVVNGVFYVDLYDAKNFDEIGSIFWCTEPIIPGTKISLPIITNPIPPPFVASSSSLDDDDQCQSSTNQDAIICKITPTKDNQDNYRATNTCQDKSDDSDKASVNIIDLPTDPVCSNLDECSEKTASSDSSKIDVKNEASSSETLTSFAPSNESMAEKEAKLASGFYASDMEAFLDGAPLFDFYLDQAGAFDSNDDSDEEMKPSSRRKKKK